MKWPGLRKAAIGLGIGMASLAGQAQAACGIEGTASAQPAIYDPFSPNALVVSRVELRLTRRNDDAGNKTDIVNFYIKSSSSDSDGISVIPVDSVGSVNAAGYGYDIFYDFNQTPLPTVSPTTIDPSPSNRFFKVYFTGNNTESDFVNILFDITLPANLNVNASTVLALDAHFGCSTTGNGKKTQQIGMIPGAIQFPITVLSALQATYAGTALDFGEIGNVTNTQVATSPGSYVTALTNYVRVQSSGPYSIELTSGGNYHMTPNGGGSATAQGKVGYDLRFLGQTRGPSNTAAISYTCPRAGVGAAFEDKLYLQARLAEGGQGKLVSPTYLDTLNVVIAPLAATTGSNTPGGQDCSALSGQF